MGDCGGGVNRRSLALKVQRPERLTAPPPEPTSAMGASEMVSEGGKAIRKGQVLAQAPEPEATEGCPK